MICIIGISPMQWAQLVTCCMHYQVLSTEHRRGNRNIISEFGSVFTALKKQQKKARISVSLYCSNAVPWRLIAYMLFRLQDIGMTNIAKLAQVSLLDLHHKHSLLLTLKQNRQCVKALKAYLNMSKDFKRLTKLWETNTEDHWFWGECWGHFDQLIMSKLVRQHIWQHACHHNRYHGILGRFVALALCPDHNRI